MHLSRAARKLHLAQPALTTQIEQLERYLGSSLFQRSNRISDLTAAGLVLLPEARAIVEHAQALPRIESSRHINQAGRGSRLYIHFLRAQKLVVLIAGEDFAVRAPSR
jgi:DNA-binding transcriptional LysR family regulator